VTAVPDQALVVFVLAVLLADVHAFVGGFTDAANAIATSVGTRVLPPRAAVLMAGVFNLLGGLAGTAVAVTIGKGLDGHTPGALSESQSAHPRHRR
jgi:PiT family inorganic phosphate transporter